MTDTPQILVVIMLETIATVMQKLALREDGGRREGGGRSHSVSNNICYPQPHSYPVHPSSLYIGEQLLRRACYASYHQDR